TGLANQAAKWCLHAVSDPTFEAALLVTAEKERLRRRLDLEQIGERRVALGRPGFEPPPRARMQTDERPRSVHACLSQQTICFLPRLGGNREDQRRWWAGQAQYLERFQVIPHRVHAEPVAGHDL